MKLADWVRAQHEPPVEPTPRAVQEEIVLRELSDAPGRTRRRRLAALLGLLVAVAALQPWLSRRAARFAPPIAATGEFLLQTGNAWAGYEIFSVDQRSVVLAAIADGAWPTPERVWPGMPALPLDAGLYAVGPDLTGAMMYYAVPGPGGHAAWLAAPGFDGAWSSGKEDPREVAAAIDQLARRFEADALAHVARGETGGPRAYNVRWGDDHIVLFRVMLLGRGRQDAVRELLAQADGGRAPLDDAAVLSVWRDQAPHAARLLGAIQSRARRRVVAAPSRSMLLAGLRPGRPPLRRAR